MIARPDSAGIQVRFSVCGIRSMCCRSSSFLCVVFSSFSFVVVWGVQILLPFRSHILIRSVFLLETVFVSVKLSVQFHLIPRWFRYSWHFRPAVYAAAAYLSVGPQSASVSSSLSYREYSPFAAVIIRDSSLAATYRCYRLCNPHRWFFPCSAILGFCRDLS